MATNLSCAPVAVVKLTVWRCTSAPKLELDGLPKLLALPGRRPEPNDPVEVVGLPKRLALRPNELLPPNLELPKLPDDRAAV